MRRPRLLLLSTRDVRDAFDAWECLTAWQSGDAVVDLTVLDLVEAREDHLQTARQLGGTDALLLAIGAEEQIPSWLHPDAICPPSLDAVSLERRCRQLLRLRGAEEAQIRQLALREDLQKAIERSAPAEELLGFFQEFQLDVLRAAREREGTLREVLQEEQRLRQQLNEELAERRRAEEALRASEERLREAQHIARMGFWDWSITTNDLYWSDEIYRVFGLTPDEFGATYDAFLGLVHPDDRELVQQSVDAAVHEDADYGIDHRIVLPTGEVRYVHEHGEVMRDANGTPLRMVGTVIDITERKQAEARLQQALAELERSNAELEQFAYVASHDLQEPLRMVASYVQLLAKRYGGQLDGDAEEFIGYALDGVTRMRRLINDLLAYSRVETRAQAFESTDCESVLQQALANLEVAIAESDAEITHDPLPTVSGDESQLVQLLQNLIANAVKFRGDDPPRIHVSAEQKDNEWVLSVRDNGIGMEPESSGRIFRVFQRLHGPGEYPGTGIGLAVCKKIVERHGGRIWVESEPGQGSTFCFAIPIRGGEPS